MLSAEHGDLGADAGAVLSGIGFGPEQPRHSLVYGGPAWVRKNLE